MNWIRNNLKIAAPAALVGLAAVAYLAFGVFGIHTKFIDDEVSEDIPVFDSGAASVIVADEVDQATTDQENEVAEDEPGPDDPAPDDPTADEPAPDDPVAEPIDSAGPEPVVQSTPTISTVVEGQFVDRSHPGSGTAKVITDGSDQRFLRFEDFETDNGPDLFVYLTTAAADAPADDFGADGQFVNLGRLKGNVGPQNYEIPVDVDLTAFDTVVVWCDRFSAAFTAADLF